MDPGALAGSVTELLAPFLARAGATLADEAITRLPEAVGVLWTAVGKRFKGKPAAESAANDLTAKSDDADIQETFRLQLKRLLSDDPAFAEKIAGLLTSAQASVTITQEGNGAVANEGSVAAGAGGVGIGRAEKSNVALGGEKSVFIQGNPTIYMGREASESKPLASPDTDWGSRISKDSSAGGLAKESTDRAIMSVNRRRLEDLRDLQHKLNAYVQGYLDSSKEVPARIRSAVTELQNCRGKLRADLALGDDDWAGVKKAVAMVSTFRLDRQGPKFDRDFSMAQKEFDREITGLQLEMTKAAQTSEDLHVMMNGLGNAIDRLIQAEAKIEPISRVCQQGATLKLQEIEDLLKEIFRPYEQSDKARRSPEGRLSGKHSKVPRPNADLRQLPPPTRKPV